MRAGGWDGLGSDFQTPLGDWTVFVFLSLACVLGLQHPPYNHIVLNGRISFISMAE